MSGFWLGVVAATGYIPEITGSVLQPIWFILLIALACLLQREPVMMRRPHWLGLLFVACAILSLAWTPVTLNGIGALVQITVIALAFMWGSTLDSTRNVFIGLAVGLVTSDVAAFAQIKGWQGLFQDSVPAGLFVDRNVFGETSMLVLAGLIGHRLWILVPLTLPALALTHTRSAALAFMAVVFTWCWARSKLLTVVLAAFITPFAVALFQINGSMLERIAVWHDTAAAIVPWGHGIGSFMTSYPAYGLGAEGFGFRPQHAYSDYLEFAFEVGFGVIPLLLCLAQSLEVDLEPERLVIFAFLAIACFDSPAHLPTSAFIGALCAGQLARYGDPVRVGWPRLGSMLPAWQRQRQPRPDLAGDKALPL